ncbi:MAG: hypothetical protein AAFU56_02285 [Pseudomonadota bacterium]
MDKLPPFYFRIRDNGAAVFRVGGEDRHRRLDMTQIAVVNHRNGEIKPQGDRVLSEDERAAIEGWLETRREILAQRESAQVLSTIEALNRTAHWAQTKATDKDLGEVTDTLLLAMHDLRTTLVRKAADRVKSDRKS